MKSNVGTTDKVIRIIAGVLAATGAFVFNIWGLYILAGALIFTAFTGMCGLYAMLGITTCPRKKTN
jgi:hypothetical protein